MSGRPEPTAPELESVSSLSSTDDDDPMDEVDPSLLGLREISPLASWTVSTYKPGCGVAALLSPSTAHFWQSDGPQPHLLNIHFFKLVAIVKMRVYLDAAADESYTPTKMVFAAGTGEYDLVEFASWAGDSPHGWVNVSLAECGGGEGADGPGAEGVLRCMCVQIRVLENHQNGKDTHIRGVQLFARDERARAASRKADDRLVHGGTSERPSSAEVHTLGEDWMEEPEIR